MNAEVKWIAGNRLEGVSDSRYKTSMDSAPTGATAPTPMEYVLMSLCGCTMMDIVPIVEKMRKKIVKFTVKAEAKRAESHPKKFIEANLAYEIISPDLTEEEFRRAVELSQDKYCSVAAMFTGSGASLTWSVKLSRS